MVWIKWHIFYGAGHGHWPQESASVRELHEQLKDQMDSAHWDKASNGLLGLIFHIASWVNIVSAISWLDFWALDDVEVQKNQWSFEGITATDGPTWVSFALSALSLCSHVHSSLFLCTLNSENTKIKVLDLSSLLSRQRGTLHQQDAGLWF